MRKAEYTFLWQITQSVVNKRRHYIQPNWKRIFCMINMIPRHRLSIYSWPLLLVLDGQRQETLFHTVNHAWLLSVHLWLCHVELLKRGDPWKYWLWSDFTVWEKSSSSHENVSINTDVSITWTWVVSTKDKAAVTVAKSLKTKWCVKYGAPRRNTGTKNETLNCKQFFNLCDLSCNKEK